MVLREWAREESFGCIETIRANLNKGTFTQKIQIKWNPKEGDQLDTGARTILRASVGVPRPSPQCLSIDTILLPEPSLFIFQERDLIGF